MTPEQHTILQIMGVPANHHMKYSEQELLDLAFKAGKKYPAIQGADYMARNAMQYAGEHGSIDELRACMANIRRWTAEERQPERHEQLQLI